MARDEWGIEWEQFPGKLRLRDLTASVEELERRLEETDSLLNELCEGNYRSYASMIMELYELRTGRQSLLSFLLSGKTRGK